MKYFLFSTSNRNYFTNAVEKLKYWGTDGANDDDFKGLDINKDDKVVFYCSKGKSFIAVCEILEPPKSIEEYPELQSDSGASVVVRLQKIRDINKLLDEKNWKSLKIFEDLKNRRSVSGSLQSKPKREIDILDYNFITN